MDHVLVLTPAYDARFSGHYLDSIASFFYEQRFICTYRYESGNSLINTARDNLITYAYNHRDEGFTHVLWLDSDVGLPAESVAALLSRDLDVVGAALPKKVLKNKFGIRCLAMGIKDPVDEFLYPAKYLSTGSLLMKMQAVVDVCESSPTYVAGKQDTFEAFKIYVNDDKQMIGEDAHLSLSLAALGYDLFVDSSTYIFHADGGFGGAWRNELPVQPGALNGEWVEGEFWIPNDLDLPPL